MLIIETDVHVYTQYLPGGVKHVVGTGTIAWVGVVDDNTVFKHLLAQGGDMSRLELERQLLELVGPHEHIIELKGATDAGLYLERAPNGTIGD